MLDLETINQMSREDQVDLLAWLEDLVKYVRMKLGRDQEVAPRPADPVGDIVITYHKKQQANASLGRKPSGWMSVGFGKCDDKHV